MSFELSTRKQRYLRLAHELMRDARSSWTSESNRSLVAFDAGYFALLSALRPEVIRRVPDHPCPELSTLGAHALSLSGQDVEFAVALARHRYAADAHFSGPASLRWAQRAIAAASGNDGG